jgi:ketopantoate hydroxymethyltransferase
MNKGDSVVFVQTLDAIHGQGIQNLIELTVERDYGATIAVSDGDRLHLVSADLVFPDMETAVKATAMRVLARADIAESNAKQARILADDWLLKLKDFD